MSNPLRLQPCVRRIAAATLAIAAAVCALVVFTANYAHSTRIHVRIHIRDDDEIAQVFVNCRLAVADRQEGLTTVSKDLGWLKRDDIVTFQVRGWRPAGSYELSFEHDSVAERIGGEGTASHAVTIPADRLVFAYSITASGRRLGEPGCQSDAPTPFPFAAATAGTWGGARGVPFEFAVELAPGIPWVLASLGALVLAAMSICDGCRSWRTRRAGTGTKRTPSQPLAVKLGAVLTFVSLASSDPGLLFAICVVAGICSVAVAWYWLAEEDLVALGMWWLDRRTRGNNAGRPG